MACIEGPTGRAIRNRHTEECTDDRCSGCEPCRDNHCLGCRREHADVTCPACLGAARVDLVTLCTMTERLADEATEGRRSLHVGSNVPGGDALVLDAPGASAAGYLAQLEHRLRYELDTTHTADELATDPRPPFAVLLDWESRWRVKHGHHTDEPPTLDRVRAYLLDHLHVFAARDPAFVAFAREVAAMVRRVEDVLHDGERPERTRVPCLSCDVRLVKVFADTVAADHYICPYCGERYDAGRFERAKHQHLASRGAERYVPVADAVATIGRPEQTVRAWIRRGLVDTAQHPVTGRLMAWWPHVRARHLEAVERAAQRNVGPTR